MIVWKKKSKKSPTAFSSKNRNGLKMTGVTDVEAFDEECVTVYTDYGCLSISGSALHIDELNIKKTAFFKSAARFRRLFTAVKKSKEKKAFFKRGYSVLKNCSGVFDLRLFARPDL
ncbi:MAG: YabP/YqfC family sporulation protein [Anaerotruncus sp.]|nr:MAG: YabP/YqfC family sporulation protein [Anaerotruncus sp.]